MDCGQVTEGFPWNEAPKHLLRDRDGAFGTAYTRRIRAMGIRDHPVAARARALSAFPRSQRHRHRFDRPVTVVARSVLNGLHHAPSLVPPERRTFLRSTGGLRKLAYPRIVQGTLTMVIRGKAGWFSLKHFGVWQLKSARRSAIPCAELN